MQSATGRRPYVYILIPITENQKHGFSSEVREQGCGKHACIQGKRLKQATFLDSVCWLLLAARGPSLARPLT